MISMDVWLEQINSQLVKVLRWYDGALISLSTQVIRHVLRVVTTDTAVDTHTTSAAAIMAMNKLMESV